MKHNSLLFENDSLNTSWNQQRAIENVNNFYFQFMDPTEAKEFGLIDKILEQIPKAGANEEDSSGSQE